MRNTRATIARIQTQTTDFTETQRRLLGSICSRWWDAVLRSPFGNEGLVSRASGSSVGGGPHLAPSRNCLGWSQLLNLRDTPQGHMFLGQFACKIEEYWDTYIKIWPPCHKISESPSQLQNPQLLSLPHPASFPLPTSVDTKSIPQ